MKMSGYMKNKSSHKYVKGGTVLCGMHNTSWAIKAEHLWENVSCKRCLKKKQ